MISSRNACNILLTSQENISGVRHVEIVVLFPTHPREHNFFLLFFKPFFSLTRGPQNSSFADIFVYFAAGRYALSQAIVLTPLDSGRYEFSVFFTSAPGWLPVPDAPGVYSSARPGKCTLLVHACKRPQQWVSTSLPLTGSSHPRGT